MISFYFSSITFSSGERIDLEPNETLIIVGPNNAGKSSTLRELLASAHRQAVGPVISSAPIKKDGNADDFREWLEKRTHFDGNNFRWVSAAVAENQVNQFWTQPGHHASLANFFTTLSNTESRLQIGKPQSAAILGGPPAHPFHVLFEDKDKDSQFSDYFRRAFKTDLVLNRIGGQTRLHCGDRNLIGDGFLDSTIYQIMEKLKDVPQLHTQGDGMRSFVGTLLHLLTSPGSIHLIDEPEAFLHPPQARVIGQIIAELSKNQEEEEHHRQLILTTHNGDFLRGLIEGSPDRLKVARLTRKSDGKNHIKMLTVEQVRDLWDDPVLRFSNALDSIFHEACCICEDESDAKFYSAVAEASNLTQDGPDAMFVGSGGKHGAPKLIKALSALEVPIAVIVDFDILNDQNPLKKIVAAFGGDWEQIESLWDPFNKDIKQRKPSLSLQQVKQKLMEILDGEGGDYLSKQQSEEIQSAIKANSPWEEVKRLGKSYLQGQNLQRAEELIDKLKQLGLVIVPSGEMESFVPTFVSNSCTKSKWVARVLREISDLSGDARLKGARDFLATVFETIRKQM